MPVKGGERPVDGVDWIVEALLVELRQTQRNRQQRVESSRTYSCKSTGGGRRGQTRAEQGPGETTKNKSSGEERVRLSVVAANQPVTAKFHAVVPTSHGQVVGKFVAARNRQAG